MKKVLWQLLALVVLVAVGYGVIKLYPELLDREDGAVWVPPVDESDVAVDPGTYVIYQTTQVIDRGLEDRTNDDVEQTVIYRANLAGQSTELARISLGPAASSSAWAEVVGQDIFVHNYHANGRDAWLNSEGVPDVSGNDSINNIANADNRVANKDSSVWVDYSLEYENRAARVTMQVDWLGMDEALAENMTLEPPEPFELDPAELGITLGYAMPFLISDDGKTVYVREICECDSISLRGLWKFDVATQTLSKMMYVIEQDLEEYKINTATNQLIGVSYAHNGPDTDFGGGSPSAPSAIHLVDLLTDKAEVIFTHDDFVFGNVFLSPDGKWYASDYRDDIVRVRAVGAQRENSDQKVSGHVLDWVGDTLVVDRDGEIILYDLKTDTVTSIVRPVGGSYGDPDQVRVSYAGVITIN